MENRRSFNTIAGLSAVVSSTFAFLVASAAGWPWVLRITAVVFAILLVTLAFTRERVGRMIGGPIESFLANSHTPATQRRCVTTCLVLTAISLLWLIFGGGHWALAAACISIGSLAGYWGAKVCSDPDSRRAATGITIGAFMLSLAANFVAGTSTGETSLDASLASIRNLASGQQKILSGQERQTRLLEEMRDADTAWLNEILQENGLDIEKISKQDFTVTVEADTSSQFCWLNVETSPGLAALLAQTMFEFRVGDRTWNSGYWDTTRDMGRGMLSHLDVAEDGPVFIRIDPRKMGHDVGVVIGPFEYDIDLLAEMRRSINAWDWIDGSEGYWSVEFALHYMQNPLVGAIMLGPTAENLSDRIDIPLRDEFGGAVDSDAITDTVTKGINALSDHDRLFAQLEYRDGTLSPVKQFERTARQRRHDPRADAEQKARSEGPQFLNNGDSTLRLRDLHELKETVSHVIVRNGSEEWRYEVLTSHTNRLDPWWIGTSWSEPLHVPPDWAEVGVRFGFTDGTESPENTVTIPPQEQVHHWARIEPDIAEAPPAWIGQPRDHDQPQIVLFAPPGTVRVLLAQGEGEFNEFDPSTRYSLSKALRVNSLDEPLHFVYQLENGEEIGPAAYRIDDLRELVRSAYLSDVAQKRRELLVAGRIEEHSKTLERPYGNLGLLRLNLWKEPAPGVLCTISEAPALWCAIEGAEIGPSPEHFTHEIPTFITPEDIALDKHMQILMSMRNGATPFVVLPSETAEVWVRFRLTDGTRTTPVKVSIKSLP